MSSLCRIPRRRAMPMHNWPWSCHNTAGGPVPASEGPMGRFLGWAVGLVAAVAVAFGIAERIPAFQDAVMRAAIGRLVGSGPDSLYGDDALRVLLCGTASPLPHPTRAKACAAVFAGGRYSVVPTGPGSSHPLGLRPGAAG